MTMRVTMLQTRMGESGSLLVAGSTYTVSDHFGGMLVSQRLATDTDGALQPPPSEPPGLAYVRNSPYALTDVNGSRLYQFRQAALAGIPLFEPGSSVVPTASVGAGASLGASGFVTIDNESWFYATVTGTAASNNHVEINIPTFSATAADAAVIEYQTDGSLGSPMVLYLGTASYATFATGQKSLSAANTSDPFMSAGPSVAVLHKAAWTKNSYTRDTIEQQWVIAKLRVTVNNGSTRTFYLRSIRVGTQAKRGRLCVVADDGYASFVQAGVPILERFGIPSTMAIIADRVGSSSDYATLAQLKDYVAAGNACVAHGPIGGTGNLYTTYTTNAQRIADINYHRDYLLSNGLTDARGAQCYVWPQGVWNANAGEVSQLSDMYAAGYRLARAATAYPNKSGSLAAHPFALRAISERNAFRLRLPIIGHDYNGASNTADDANETTNVNRIITTIQDVADSGVDAMLMLHRVVARGAATSGGIEIEADRLNAIASAVQTQAAAGKLECVTMPELL